MDLIKNLPQDPRRPLRLRGHMGLSVGLPSWSFLLPWIGGGVRGGVGSFS